MIEYALGLGCIACLCMAGLASLGDISADMIHGVEWNINYQGGYSQDTTPIVNAQPLHGYSNKGNCLALPVALVLGSPLALVHILIRGQKG